MEGGRCARAKDSRRLIQEMRQPEKTHRLVRSRHMADGEERDNCFQIQCGL